MWFFLRMTFWLAVVLVLLPTGGLQTAPKSQVSASEAFLAAKGAVTDFEHFCERQQEACVVGSRTAVDPPSLKWSDLKYVIWHQGGPICRGSATSLRKSLPS